MIKSMNQKYVKVYFFFTRVAFLKIIKINGYSNLVCKQSLVELSSNSFKQIPDV